LLASQFREHHKFENIIGRSSAIRSVISRIIKVAPSDATVLITGESGTGKELVARAVHKLSPRRDGPFIKVNCAAIPAELIESELFGYERGAFTGATGRKRGMFEIADGGTLFLDEIGDMSSTAQAKVLRALQSGEISRVGSETTTQVDVRVIAATNKDLDAEVKAGRFREDLYFRLNVVPIHSPPLRDRRSDVPLLAAAFIEEFCRENGFRTKPLAPGVVERLMSHSWPGNVRELKNVVERIVILSGEAITTDDLPEEIVASVPAGAAAAPPPPGARLPLREYKEQIERAYIIETLREHEWNISRASAILGIERTNLHKKMKAYGIVRET
ncbi:MAG: sigma-54-dependent Fis family transcriptional regulator, partial [Deltaproteobacteria bacterium]|nr:sigma-54-dependent Fis family transcriptional regulator [Deltaproteobacteria bacterium]